jgi:transcriptional regulator with XRE-family HTH domain
MSYKAFGLRLKRIRESAKETILDLSGAVEVEPQTISRIESGEMQPSEDLVLLLINHFELKEKEADSFWNLAGYEPPHNEENEEPAQTERHTLVVALPEGRIVYTDTAQVVSNQYGVTINFMQNTGGNGQPVTVSRVGMSHQHAQSVLQLLQDTLAASKPKQLPRSTEDK